MWEFFQGLFELFFSLEKEGGLLKALIPEQYGPLWNTVNFGSGGCKFNLFLVLKLWISEFDLK